MAAVTTASIQVCGHCGAIGGIEGQAMLSSIRLSDCHGNMATGKHVWKYVLVVIPYA